MSAIVDRAGEYVAALKGKGLNASTDVKKLKLPGILVPPIPDLAFTLLDNSSVEATFKIWAIVAGPGGTAAAEKLEEIVLKAADVLPVVTAEPGSYQLPAASDPMPAYQLTLTTDVLDVTT